MLVYGFDANEFTLLITDFIKRNKPAHGSTQKDQARNEGIHMGYVEGLADALSYIGTVERIKLMAPISDPVKEAFVSGVYNYDCLKFLRELRKDWDTGVYKEKSDPEFFVDLWDKFYNEIIMGDKWRDQYVGQRKRAILAGMIEPDESDADWLREERDNLSAVVGPYDSALAKLQVK